MEKRRRKNNRSVYDLDAIRAYQRVPARMKLKWLEEINAFFRKAMPAKSKRAWKALQDQGRF